MCCYIIYVDAFNLQKAAIKYSPSTQGKYIALLLYTFFSLLKCMLLSTYFFSSVLLNTSFSNNCFCYFCLERMRDAIQIQLFLSILIINN